MYKPEEAKLFGAAIKQFLTERELNPYQFAKQAGLELSYVSKLLNPKSGKEIAEPRKKTRQKLAKGLGITEQELLEYIEQYRNSNLENKTLNFSGVVEPEKAIANPHQETVESDAGSIEERIFKATNQLDPERPMFSRMSAIQALGEIAKDYSRYQWNIMEILAAFVRNAPRRKEEEGIPDDIQEALTVIGRRNSEKDLPNMRLDLSNSDIRGAVLIEASLQKANLSGANLQGGFLKGAKLQESVLLNANLERASLIKTNLERAFLTKANLQHAMFNGTNLEGANLIQTNLQHARFIGTNLEGADLSKANLKGADLSKANLSGASLQGAYLYEADLTKAKNIELNQIESAYRDVHTLLPEGFAQSAYWKQFR